jgi:large subunit ribosomal protein L29
MKRKEKIQELLQLEEKELLHRLSELKEKLIQLKIDLKLGKVKNVREMSILKKDIARVKTILKQKFNKKV